jgi:hypothetical protein
LEDCFVLEDAFPAIVDKEVFRLAQERTRLRKGATQRGRPRLHPLSGLMKCGCCGHGCSCYRTKPRRIEYRYYRCLEHNRGVGASADPRCGFSINADELEKQVVDKIKEEFLSDEQIASQAEHLMEQLSVRREQHSGNRSGLVASLAEWDGRVSVLERRLGEVDDDMLAPLQLQIREARQKREKVQLELEAEDRIGGATERAVSTEAKAIISRLNRLREEIVSLDRETLRKALHEIIEKVTVHTVPIENPGKHNPPGRRGTARVVRIEINYRRDQSTLAHKSAYCSHKQDLCATEIGEFLPVWVSVLDFGA